MNEAPPARPGWKEPQVFFSGGMIAHLKLRGRPSTHPRRQNGESLLYVHDRKCTDDSTVGSDRYAKQNAIDNQTSIVLLDDSDSHLYPYVIAVESTGQDLAVSDLSTRK